MTWELTSLSRNRFHSFSHSIPIHSFLFAQLLLFRISMLSCWIWLGHLDLKFWLIFCSSWYLSHSPHAISIILWLIDWSQPQVAWKSLLSWMPPMICFKPVKMLTTMPPLRPTFLLLTKSFFLSKKGNYNWFYFMSRFSVLDCSYLYIGLFAALWIWLWTWRGQIKQRLP